MRYIISWNGAGIAVGLLENEGVEEEFNLAHNILGTKVQEDLFYGVMGFKGIKQFWKFLILKEYLPLLMRSINPSKKEKMSLLKMCFQKVRKIRDNEVLFENFIREVSMQNTSYYDVGQYQDEKIGYEFS